MRATIVQIENLMGQARMPATLKKAGWDVAAACPKGSYLSLSRYVDRRSYFTLMREAEIVRDVVQSLESWTPDMVFPADDHSVHLLCSVAAMSDRGVLTLSPSVREAIGRSLIIPGAWPVIERPSLMAAYAERIGLRVPARQGLATFGDADTFASRNGYPIVVREELPFADEVVTVCYGESELLDAVNRLLPPQGGRRFYLQQWVSGHTIAFEAAALGGRVLAARTLEFAELVPGSHDIPAVVRVTEDPKVSMAARRIATAAGANGIVSVRFKSAGESEEPWFNGVRFRLDETSYLGIEAGVDLAKTLLEALSGQRVTEPRARIGHLQALYPHEAMRDPRSAFIRPGGDVPSDDPGLDEAFRNLLSRSAERVEQPI